jgi:hypothetical protein
MTRIQAFTFFVLKKPADHLRPQLIFGFVCEIIHLFRRNKILLFL